MSSYITYYNYMKFYYHILCLCMYYVYVRVYLCMSKRILYNVYCIMYVTCAYRLCMYNSKCSIHLFRYFIVSL